MRNEIIKITKDLEQGTITAEQAQTLLFSVSESNLYNILAKTNNLVETNMPNVWVKNEPKDEESLFETTYILTKLGFKVKHEYKQPKTKMIFQLFNWIFYSR